MMANIILRRFDCRLDKIFMMKILMVLFVMCSWHGGPTFLFCSAFKVPNLIPRYCDSNIESKSQLESIHLNSTGPKSWVTIGASILQSIEIVPNYKCWLSISSPPNHGLIVTMRKASLNNQDQITFKSGNTNTNRVWKKSFENHDPSSSSPYSEIVSIPVINFPSTIRMQYIPTVGVSEYNAGFDLAVTVYKDKKDSCGTDWFDCGNGRCISPLVKCDEYNNCGNNFDETGCSGLFGASLWLVGISILLIVIVLILIIFVWIKMSRS